MKNLMVYVNPKRGFDKEHQILAKVQIDNMLDLGWRPDDIVFMTNFPYEYNGVKTLLVADDFYYDFAKSLAKIRGVLHLFDLGMVGDDLWWLHDLDCYQCSPVTEEELGLNGFDGAITNYGRVSTWACAGWYFKKSYHDVFEKVLDKAIQIKHHEERAVAYLKAGDIEARTKVLNISYNFQNKNLRSCYPMAIKPIRACHFHLHPDHLDFFMWGRNKINTVIVPDRLKEIFAHHGVRDE